jgi:phosphatidylglycerophosphatase C
MRFGSDVPAWSSMPILSSAEVVTRLDALARVAHGEGQKALVALDADGTLWSGDVGIDSIRTLLASRGVRASAGPALREEAKRCRVELREDANDQAAALYDAYEKGTYHEERAFRMMTWAFAGYRADEMRDFANDVVRQGSLPARMHAEVVPIVRWASDRGIPIFVVSASPVAVVEAAVELLALPVAQVLAMSPAVDNGVLLPEVLEPATYGSGKVEALLARMPGHTLLAAFGDSVFDLPLLGEARLPVAVRPKPELRQRASECPGLVELALPPP